MKKTHVAAPAETISDFRVLDLLAKLTLEEKAALTVGRDSPTTQPIERLGIPVVWVSDKPTGLRKARSGSDMSLGQNLPATCFPTESALGASWDIDLVREVARALASSIWWPTRARPTA